MVRSVYDVYTHARNNDCISNIACSKINTFTHTLDHGRLKATPGKNRVDTETGRIKTFQIIIIINFCLTSQVCFSFLYCQFCFFSAVAASAIPFRRRCISIPFAIVYCLIAYTNIKALVGCTRYANMLKHRACGMSGSGNGVSI